LLQFELNFVPVRLLSFDSLLRFCGFAELRFVEESFSITASRRI